MKTLTKLTIVLLFTLTVLICYTQYLTIERYKQIINEKNRTELLHNVQLNNMKCLKN